MNLGSIGKALANQAMENTKNTVLDAVRTPDPPKATSAEAARPAIDTGATILGQIQAMQRPMSPEHELLVTLRAGDEILRVTEIFVPNTHVLVFAGTDAAGNVTRLITPVETAQVVCKIVKVAPGANPVRVNILTPKAPPKPGA
jgi:hypothetical protein